MANPTPYLDESGLSRLWDKILDLHPDLSDSDLDAFWEAQIKAPIDEKMALMSVDEEEEL